MSAFATSEERLGDFRSALVLGAFISAFTLVAAACAPGEDEVEARTVESSDGKLTVEVPPGVARDVDVTVQLVPEAERPDELEGVDLVGDGYRLAPAGTTFSEPVTVTLRLEADGATVPRGT